MCTNIYPMLVRSLKKIEQIYFILFQSAVTGQSWQKVVIPLPKKECFGHLSADFNPELFKNIIKTTRRTCLRSAKQIFKFLPSQFSIWFCGHSVVKQKKNAVIGGNSGAQWVNFPNVDNQPLELILIDGFVIYFV